MSQNIMTEGMYLRIHRSLCVIRDHQTDLMETWLGKMTDRKIATGPNDPEVAHCWNEYMKARGAKFGVDLALDDIRAMRDLDANPIDIPPNA